ncbi:hypothetical protein P3719_18600 [Vibrio parahaemolyticus]|uniref:Uncharacterized protein n=2 Tax=Vibrio harveyi group TaxID=717610 RepID=A0AA47JMW3_VIBPH|nr:MULTISPECIES: hypothetical protein [Vibrio]EJG1066158.1 hypothetical protein [Vibrio parahaemolyticus O1]MDW1807481.1 hypothetical protein [Vibrio sp. Vb2362]MDW2296361.1 hypothetical protein [Vibrio sp. 1404]OOH98817.1 hypothetical protein BIW16_18570 [Vibrio sp. OULL4]ALR95664.1 hypothetical protein AT730_25840 [Vibrio alginolyticus]
MLKIFNKFMMLLALFATVSLVSSVVEGNAVLVFMTSAFVLGLLCIIHKFKGGVLSPTLLKAVEVAVVIVSIGCLLTAPPGEGFYVLAWLWTTVFFTLYKKADTHV